ncbi:MAG: DUF4124 domain-containing protein [Ketobacter sp.]|nr:MAG: DUF4124 domain-containing protein [Ketobacter sp.]
MLNILQIWRNGFMTLRLLFNVCLLLIVVNQAHAGKLYKIVDAEGNVTFSQFPPAPQPEADQQGVTVNEMSVSGESASQVRLVGNNQYCGEIRLPSLNPKEPEGYLELDELRQAWQNEMEGDTDLNNVRFRMYMGRYNLSRDPSEAGQRKRDLQCAIEWVDKQQGDVAKVRDSLNQEAAKLNQQIVRLKAKRDKQCGSEPYRDPHQPASTALWERWSDCYYQYQDELYELEYKVSEIPGQ